MKQRFRRTAPAQRRFAWVAIATVLALLLNLGQGLLPGTTAPTASAHNLNASAIYVYFDPDTQATLDNLIATNQRPVGQPLLRPGDELGLIIKAVPDLGTTTGVGGYTTFYIPNGVQVVDAAYIMPGDLAADGITGFDKVPMKGQAQMPAVGAGGESTVSLVGVTRGPNILGVTSPIVTAANLNLGTLPGVYGDTGIFFSTAPETAYGTYTGGKITNNSGDEVGLRTALGTTLNKWDAWQMAAYGIAGTTNPAYPSAALVDSNQRGYAPWGLANVVAGPQSGYAWGFNFATYSACDPTPTGTPVASCIDQATQQIGPWQRIKYPGSQFADDPPGARPLVQPYTRGADASNSGWALSPATPLTQTLSQTDSTSPKAIRFAIGQLTYYQPEYVWVKIKVHDNTAILDPTGCPKWTVDTFGGDAGGDSGGKDHIWRYYDPNSVTLNGCLAVGKPATRELVKVGDTFQYKVKLYNAGGNDFSTVQIQDTLPSGATYISAVPAPSNVSLPNLTWTVAPFLRSQMFEATVTVKASSAGLISNNICTTGQTTGGQTINSCGKDITVTGNQPLLRQSKSVSPTSVAPGGTVQYTISMLNIGSGPTGNPIGVTEYLPAGFTYVSKDSVTINGANVTAATTVNSSNANQPVFTVPGAINAGQGLELKFTAQVSASAAAGSYCNSYKSTQNSIGVLTGALACVTVGGGQIGDTIYRDWDGDGVQDAAEEGIAGVTVRLYAGDGTTLLATTTTDADGRYLFAGRAASNYVVQVNGGVALTGTTLTGDPDGTLDNRHAVTLTTNQQYLTADFGYQPGGAGAQGNVSNKGIIGDTVFEDVGNDGFFNAGVDIGISGVTVSLYADRNGDGIINLSTDALVRTTTTNASGVYSFTFLGEGYDYIAKVTDNDPALATYFGATPYQGSSVNPHPVDNLTGSYLNADFGYWRVAPGSIGDTVCIDVDGDKLCTAADQGISGVDVQLYRDADGDGEPDPSELVTTIPTDASGHYTFAGLGPGAYIVVVDTTDPQIPAGYLPSTPSQTAVTLAVAQNRTDVDFPFSKVLTKAVDKTNANAGDTLKYTITANYPSGVLLQNVTITDSVPTGTTFASAGQGGTQSDGVIVWNLGSNSADKPATTAPPDTALCTASTTLTAVADTYVWKGSPSYFGGTENLLYITPSTVDYAPGLLRFDLTTIPAGAQIQAADLRLVVTISQANQVHEVHRMNTDWTQGTSATNGATWNDSNGTGSAGDWATGTFSANDYSPTLLGKITPSTAGAKTLSIIPAVTDWVKNGVPNRGLVLVPTGTSTADVEYASRENGTTANRPTLAVSYNYQSPTGCSGTTNLTSVADTYVNQKSPTTANGTTTTMLTFPKTNEQRSSLVRFDLSSIPPGATITSATFKPTVTKAAPAGKQVDEVRPVVTTWTESATWNDADGAGSGDWAAGSFSSSDYGASLGTITPTSTGQKSLAITSQVNDWVNNGVPNRGLALLPTGSNTDNKKIATYGTRENTTVASRPVLTVVWSQAVSTLPQTTVELHAEPLFLGGVGQIKVTMLASTQATVTNAISVTPPAGLTINATGGASGVKSSGPTPAGPVTITVGSPASFVYIYNVTPGSLPGTLSFTGKPAPAANFGTATSEEVIVSPALTFTTTVDTPATVSAVENFANISAREADTKLGPDMCYVVADGSDGTTADRLLSIDPITGDFVDIGATSTNNMEALTWNLAGTKLYGVEAGQLVTLTAESITRTVVGTIGTIAGTFGNITTPDVDALSFDPTTGILYAVARREDGTNGNTLLDVLFQLNPATGARVANAYGAGRDYITITTNTLATPLYDVDDIAFDDAGVLYAIANDPTMNIGLGDHLVTIDKATGAVTDIDVLIDAADGTTAVTDVEGLSFLAGVGLIASTGDASTTTTQRNKVWTVDADTAELTEIAAVPAYSQTDYEAVACVPGPVEPGGLILPPTPSNEVLTALGASIGDFVWADLDGDTVQDVGEPGLAEVQVCATPTGGGAAVCTTTDALGKYLIGGLTNAANYNVTLTPGTLPAGYQPTTATTLTVTATTAGTLTADFGLRPPGTATIGDTVWLDADNDGVLDGGESGLPGITVRLYASDGTTLLATTTTNASGVYTFTGLNPATYQVRVDPTSVVTTTYGVTSTVGAAMTATTGTVNPRTVTITTPGQAITNADFGYNWSGSIGDYVWYDNNRNGAPDESPATPIAGAFVLLYYDADGDGILDPSEYTPVNFMDTNAAGIYTFGNLPPGRYLVDVYEDSFTVGGNREAIPTTPDVRAVNLAAGQAYLDADFGYFNGALIEGHVFWDKDRNGLFDAAETGLTPVGVTLTGFDNFGNPISASTTTDASGKFAFLVPEGTYTVTYSTPNVLAIDPTLGDVTTPTSYVVTAEAGPDWHVDLLFGVDNVGRIGDTIWNDAEGVSANGIYSPTLGETGLANVTVNLFDSTGAFVAAQMTDANGNYLFMGLASGTYTVSVVAGTLPANFEQTGDPDQPGVRCTAGACDNRTVVTLTGGVTQVLTADFGYRSTGTGGGAGLTTLRGYVYQDLAADGAYTTTDPLISDVTVRVSCGVSGTFQTTTTANGIGGNWTVAGVPEGASCTVTVDTTTLPSPAYVQTGAPNPPSTGQTCVTCNSSYTLTVPTGGQTNLNFGYRQQLGGIGGTVVIGPNANGIADAGETRLQGVTITLTYAGADGFLGTGDDTTTVTQTNASGTYSFTNLLPGLYQVVETNLPTYLSVADRDGGNPDNITVNLTAGQHVAGRDFEDVPPPSAAVSKTLTTPAGGVAVVGDTITFTLRITNTGVVTLTAVTITDTYDAGKLTPTGYSVTPNGQASGVLTWTTNLTPSLPLAAGAGLTLTVRFRADALTTPGVTTNTVTAAGQDVFGQRAGPLTGQATVQIQPSAAGLIGDRVWWDINGDGSQDAGEPGIAGVDLLLNGGTITTTGAAGDYLFSPLAAGTYTVTIAPAEFQAGGTLHNWAATYPAGLVHTFTITQSQVITTADFGLNIASSYTVTKRLITLDPVRPGEPISFTLRVTNTGATWLAALPMQDAYNNTFLTYGFGGDFAQLDSDDHNNDGVLNWTDALSVTRGGPGLLAPAASTVITVWFTAHEDTQTEGALGTANRITVTAPAFDPDGPGPLPAGATQPSQGATAYVRIQQPTGLTLTGFGATAEKGKVTLTWQTANEAQLLGFNILRRVSNGPLQPVNPELIAAEHAGSNQGDRYTFTDQPAAGAYAYLLEMIHLDGSRTRTNPIAVRVGP